MALEQIAGLRPLIRKVHLRLADQLGLAIIRGDFAQGKLLPSESKLCEMLGVSRTAMREAIRGLSAKGLVESKSKIGTRVRSSEDWNHLDADVLRWQLEVAETGTYLRKVFELRNATEPAAAALAAEYATADDQERIQAAFDDMVEAGSDNAKWVAADLRFHKAIYIATHNEYFWPIGQMFGIALKEMFTIAARGRHRPRAVEEHRNLLNAIIGRKADEARQLSQLMVSNATGDIASIRTKK